MKPHLFKRDDAKRIKQWAYTDSGLILQQPRYLENKTKYAIGLVKTGGISARSTTTAGSGDVTIYKAESTTLATSGRDVTAYNLDDSTYSAGEYVTLMQEYSTGKWVVIQGAGCDCGVGNIEIRDTPFGTPTASQTVTVGSYTMTCTFDSATYADGDRITVQLSMTFNSGPVPTSTQIAMQSSPNTSFNVLWPMIYDCSLFSSDASTSDSSGSSIRERHTYSPTLGVAETITLEIDYTKNWPNAQRECDGYFSYWVFGFWPASPVGSFAVVQC